MATGRVHLLAAGIALTLTAMAVIWMKQKFVGGEIKPAGLLVLGGFTALVFLAALQRRGGPRG